VKRTQSRINKNQHTTATQLCCLENKIQTCLTKHSQTSPKKPCARPGHTAGQVTSRSVFLSFRSWTGRETMSTSRLTRLSMGTRYVKWRISRTRRWTPPVAIRQLPWSFDTWPQERLPTSSGSPEWVTGSKRAFPVQILPTERYNQLALC
jgi:hypothetical protein